jgi:glycosyltransferase involved in cell wall biosynthesis
MKKFRIHVLGLPHTKTNKEFTACAYTQKVWKFCKMMKGRGHYLMHYGHEDSVTDADENVTVITNEVWDKVYGTHDYRSKLFKYDTNDEAYQTFFRNAIEEIGKRKQYGDIILPFWGSGVRPICDAHPDLCIIEPGIGYAGGMWSRFKIFESYAIYHAYGGMNSVGFCNQSWYDQVIPNYFDLDEFEYSSKKEDYFLFVGRVYDGKGVNVAIQATEAIGAKLKIAGQIADEYYEKNPFPPHVEFIGYVGEVERKNLMKGAIASFLPSMYVEPFGGVQIENLLCGTPTITTDWGAFAENNIQGVTGYRCRTFEDFVKAARDCQAGKIKSIDCRRQGERFSLEEIAPKYEKYFEEALDLTFNEGWYTIKDESLYTQEWLNSRDKKKVN